jgi:hypothetical protein
MKIFIKDVFMERKVGTVYSVNPKGWFFVCVTPQERYFIHISELKADRFAVVGDKVNFIPAPPRKEGQLPCATDAQFAEVAQ